MATKMINMGVKDRFSCCDVPRGKKAKKSFPNLNIEKPIGDFDVGDQVVMIVRATVQSVRKDEHGFSQGFKVNSIGVKDSKKFGDKLAEEMLEGQI